MSLPPLRSPPVERPLANSTRDANAAARVLLARKVRSNFSAWCVACGFKPALHHAFIIDKLERVVRGELHRLMILVPPGSAKSTYASVLFPPWFLAQRSGNSILACSYSFTLVERFGKKCRNLIEGKSELLGYTLSKHSQAAGDWATSTGSVYFAAGVGAGIAGHRADLGLIDDYLGSQEDADSQLIRDKQWDWYWNDFWPRLRPGAAQIIIANRRHEDDLVGRLLEKEGDKWTVIRLPMLAEENDPLGRKVGDRLWPEYFTEDMVKTAQSRPRMWGGLYQQRPAPEEGNFFNKDWIVPYGPGDLPANLRVYVGADYAVTKDQTNDRTCFLPAGMDEQGRLWILPDWFWKLCDTGEAVDEMLRMCKRRKPLAWWLGKEVITKAIGPFLTREMREQNVFVPYDELTEARDKQTKAQSIKARMRNKMVLFPTFAPGWERAQHEILTFPAGQHDDFVDALSKLGQGLDCMTPANAIKQDESELPVDWKPTVRWLKEVDKRQKAAQAVKEGGW